MHRFAAPGWPRLKYLILISLYLAGAIDARAEEAISLALPIKCQPGVTCFFQNYVDHDASDKGRDYRCGGRSYDGHDGTDIIETTARNSGRTTIQNPTWAGALVLALEDGFRLHRLIDPETTPPDSFFRAIGDLQQTMGISST